MLVFGVSEMTQRELGSWKLSPVMRIWQVGKLKRIAGWRMQILH